MNEPTIRRSGDPDTVTVDGLVAHPATVARRSDSLTPDGRLQIDDTPTRCRLVKDVRRIVLTAGRRPDRLPPEERAKI